MRSSTSTRFPSPWYHRCFWTALEKRLSAGNSVLHSDLDAFLVGDPWPYLNAGNSMKVDIQSHFQDDRAPGTSWELTLNPGFMLFRNTPALVSAVGEICSRNADKLR